MCRQAAPSAANHTAGKLRSWGSHLAPSPFIAAIKSGCCCLWGRGHVPRLFRGLVSSSVKGGVGSGGASGRQGWGRGNSGAQAGGQGASSHLDGPPNGPGYAACSFPTCSQNSLSPVKGWETRRDSCAESKSQYSTLQQEATRHPTWNSGVSMTCGPSLWAQDPGKQLPASQSLGETGT